MTSTTCGHCADDAPFLEDFYSVIDSMNLDGSERTEETWSVGECNYTMTSWAGNGNFYAFAWYEVQGAAEPVRIGGGAVTPLGGESLEDACLMRSSPDPGDEGLTVNPCMTGDARHHGLSSDTIAAGTTLSVSGAEGVFSWFRWQ